MAKRRQYQPGMLVDFDSGNLAEHLHSGYTVESEEDEHLNLFKAERGRRRVHKTRVRYPR
jgi:hypothetical protein